MLAFMRSCSHITRHQAKRRLCLVCVVTPTRLTLLVSNAHLEIPKARQQAEGPRKLCNPCAVQRLRAGQHESRQLWHVRRQASELQQDVPSFLPSSLSDVLPGMLAAVQRQPQQVRQTAERGSAVPADQGKSLVLDRRSQAYVL